MPQPDALVDQGKQIIISADRAPGEEVPVTSFDVPGAWLQLEYSDEGGHPVVQLHGLTSSRERDRVLDLDLGRGLSGTRLLRYDARGHGRSTGRPVADDYRWPRLAQDLLALLDVWFPGERVHGVGPSMGCATLLHAALLDPGRFSGLTLMVPPTAWETRAAKAHDYERSAEAVEAHGLELLLRAQAAAPAPPATVEKRVNTGVRVLVSVNSLAVVYFDSDLVSSK